MNLKEGGYGVIATVIVVLLSFLFFFVVNIFLPRMNNTCDVTFVNVTGTGDQGCRSGQNWITNTDRSILSNAGTIEVIMIVFELLSGMIASIYLAIRK